MSDINDERAEAILREFVVHRYNGTIKRIELPTSAFIASELRAAEARGREEAIENMGWGKLERQAKAEGMRRAAEIASAWPGTALLDIDGKVVDLGAFTENFKRWVDGKIRAEADKLEKA